MNSSTIEKQFNTPLDLIQSLETEKLTTEEILTEVRKQFPHFNPLPADEWYNKPD
jgi:hypothetical protein